MEEGAKGLRYSSMLGKQGSNRWTKASYPSKLFR
jgi:hypothetical protein